MAEFETVVRAAKRMCKHICDSCPLSVANNGTPFVCKTFIEEHPEKAEKIIMKWAAEHPVETMKDRFFKMFPDAPLDEEGMPIACARVLGWVDECLKGSDCCYKCWGRPYEERRNK